MVMIRSLLLKSSCAVVGGLSLVGGLTGLHSSPAIAQGTSGLMEFRWDSDKDYRRLYYYQTSTIPNERAEWYLTLREKDRKTAILKLTVTVPDYFDAKLKPPAWLFARSPKGACSAAPSASRRFQRPSK